MSTLIKAPKDFWTGVIFVGVGGAALWIAQAYTMGTTSRMGPGYFPRVLAGLLMAFGVLSLIRSLRVVGPPIGGFALKACILVAGGTAVFGFLLAKAGLVVSLLVMILGSASASQKFRFEWRALAAMVGLVVFCVLVFIKGLGLPIPLLGSWFGG